MTTRPTIQTLVPQYVAVGITPRNAIRYIVDCHMRSHIARGKGHAAERRVGRLGYVSTEFGVGRMNSRGELEQAHGVHVSPVPRRVRPATVEEVGEFYALRASVARELTAYYDSREFTGD